MQAARSWLTAGLSSHHLYRDMSYLSSEWEDVEQDHVDSLPSFRLSNREQILSGGQASCYVLL